MTWKNPTLRLWIAFLWIACVTLGVYCNSFTVPCIYDDTTAILTNANIRSLWPIWKAMESSSPSTVSGRPLVGLSVALNYAISRDLVWSYHAFNLALHLTVALLLMLLLRRIFQSDAAPRRIRPFAEAMSYAVVFLWAIHPLNSETVVYIIQRTEIMVVFFYLLTIYATVRAFETDPARALPRRLWLALGVASCAAGMGCKEVMVSAPLAVLVYDRLFLHRSWSEALKRWWLYYACLAATLLILAAILIKAPRGDSVGFHSGIAWNHYLYTQAWVLADYIRLLFVPFPLNICYDPTLTRHLFDAALPGAVILFFIGLTIRGLVRGTAGAFAGSLFFMVLAPSSSFIPIVTEVVAERRMYLPSAAVLAVLAALAVNFFMKLSERCPAIGSPLPTLAAGTVTLGVVFGFLSFERTNDYQSPETIWRDAVAKSPDLPAAINNLGVVYGETGRIRQAAACYLRASKLRSNIPEMYESYMQPRASYAVVLGAMGDIEGSRREAEAVLAIKPNFPRALLAMGIYHMLKGEHEKALEYAERSVTSDPDYCATWGLRARLRIKFKRYAEAAADFAHAVEMEPGNSMTFATLDDVVAAGPEMIRLALPSIRAMAQSLPKRLEPRRALARAYTDLGQTNQAVAEFQGMLEIAPNDITVWQDYATLLARLGRIAEAAQAIEHVVQLNPGSGAARARLGTAYASLGRNAEALRQWSLAIESDPGNADARLALARAELAAGNPGGAASHLAAVLQRDPANAPIRSTLINLLSRMGRFDAAVEFARQGVAVSPTSLEAMASLVNLLAAAPGLPPESRGEALRLAQDLDRRAQGQAPQATELLATALAATGDFAAAAAAQARAIEQARAAGMTQALPAMNEKLGLFRAGKPYLISGGR